jgi:hypothetical protein
MLTSAFPSLLSPPLPLIVPWMITSCWMLLL